MTDETRAPITRRRFIQGGAAAAVGLAGVAQHVGASQATAQKNNGLPLLSRISGRQQNGRRPNILLLMVDEQRFPAVYETATLAAFRNQYLTTQQTLAKTGIEFRGHYASSVACVPSRVSLFTGHYPSLHGATQTDGAAKSAVEIDLFWLDPNTVPTLGDYFQQAGYQTHYRGKWHLSHADLLMPGTNAGLPTYDQLGRRVTSLEQLYQKADRLADYGFSGWIGREPHGANPRDSASSAGIYKPTGEKVFSRDVATADQTIELLAQLESQTQPWLVVSSFVNPHDIVLWGLFSRLANLYPEIPYTFDFSIGANVPSLQDLFDPAKFALTHGEDLSTKPRAQVSYRDTYDRWMQPVLNDQYYRFYYHLHHVVDQELARVYAALQKSAAFQDTIVVFTSDHGDLLGAHGGMHQKWHTAYEEALHVPLIFSGPRLATQGKSADLVTSHVDLIPTLLGLIGADPEPLRQQLLPSHYQAQPLVGRDLSGIVLGTADPATLAGPIYFMTDDEPSRGLQQRGFSGLGENSVAQPNHVEAVVARIDGQLWKYTEYRDRPEFWSSPSSKDVMSRSIPPLPTDEGTYTIPYDVRVKTTEVATEPRDTELYNVSEDPLELTNRALDSNYSATKSAMKALLEDQRTKKRLSPQTGPASGGQPQAYLPGVFRGAPGS